MALEKLRIQWRGWTTDIYLTNIFIFIYLFFWGGDGGRALLIIIVLGEGARNFIYICKHTYKCADRTWLFHVISLAVHFLPCITEKVGRKYCKGIPLRTGSNASQGNQYSGKYMNMETREKGLIKKCLQIDLVFGNTERKEKAHSVILRQHNFITAIEY